VPFTDFTKIHRSKPISAIYRPYKKYTDPSQLVPLTDSKDVTPVVQKIRTSYKDVVYNRKIACALQLCKQVRFVVTLHN